MWESIIVPISLIQQLPSDKLYALMDILSMTDENLEVHISIRQLMIRWGWSNTKVINFIKFLEQKDVCKTLRRQKKDTQKDTKKDAFLLINQWFIGCVKDIKKDTQKDEKKTLKRHLEDTHESKNFKVSIGKEEAIKRITDTWNELSEYGIEQISILGISSMQWQNIIILAQEYGVEDILKTIERIKRSDFLQGKSKERWKITFNWFLRDGNYEKVRGGEYDGINNEYESKTEQMLENHYDMVSEWAIKKKMQEEIHDN